MVNFTNDEILALQGKEAVARIMTYNLKKGYGFARTEDGREIFISSYQVLNRKEEKKLFFGTKISFKYGLYKDKLCATEVQVVERFPSGNELNIVAVEDSWAFDIESILKVGKSQLLKNPSFLEEVLAEEGIPADYEAEGYDERDFLCLFVETKSGEVYRFFDMPSKLFGHGHLKVAEVYTDIYKEFFT